MATSRSILVDSTIYNLDVVNKAAYSLSGVASFAMRQSSPSEIAVFISSSAGLDVEDVTARFNNALVDFRVREQLARETTTVRDLIFRQAFVEADLEA